MNKPPEDTLDNVANFPGQEEVRAKYPWLPAMGEISGFGGGYEATCRNMLYAGLKWMDGHPTTAQHVKHKTIMKGISMHDICGSLLAATDLEKAIMEACYDDCTGAMHHAVTRAIIHIQRNGWTWYQGEMSKADA